ncbi:alpha/beta fold hydrolase [Nocardia thailandica]
MSVTLHDQGTGALPALVLIHGIPGSIHWFGALAERLGEFRVIRVDTSGQGAGGAPLDSAARTAEVVEALAALELPACVVVGHSFGAELALGVAAALPGVRGAVVIGQSPDYTGARVPTWAAGVVRPSVIRFAQRWTPAPLVRLGNRSGFGPGFRAATVAGLADLVVADFRAAQPAGLHYALSARGAEFAADPLDARVARLGLPVLVVHGRHDRLYDCARAADRYAAAGARVHIVEEAGHSPQVERPDEVAAVIRDFLTTL